MSKTTYAWFVWIAGLVVTGLLFLTNSMTGFGAALIVGCLCVQMYLLLPDTSAAGFLIQAATALENAASILDDNLYWDAKNSINVARSNIDQAREELGIDADGTPSGRTPPP